MSFVGLERARKRRVASACLLIGFALLATEKNAERALKVSKYVFGFVELNAVAC
jgi:hypothetical protein